MIVSSTGIAYSILFGSVSFLTYRFFQYWRKSRGTTSKLFLYFAICLAALALTRAISGVFFARDSQFLYVSVGIVSFVEGLMAAVVAYLLLHLKFPKVIPWLGFAAFFSLGVLVSFSGHFSGRGDIVPFLDSSGAINFNVGLDANVSWYPILRTILLLFSFVSLLFVSLRQFMAAKERYLRVRTFGLSLALFLAILIGASDFIIISVLKFEALNRDIGLGIASIMLFLVIYFTQKPTPREVQVEDEQKF